MLSIALWCLAAIFNSIMDALEEGHFQTSIFRNLNQKFWYKSESWKHAKRIFGYPIDAWHLSKSAMIICLLAIAANYITPFPYYWLNFISLGGMWNLLFNVFYNHIFKKP